MLQNEMIKNRVTNLYRDVVNDRVLEIGLAVGGKSQNAELLETALHYEGHPRSEEFLLTLANNIISYANTFGEGSPIAQRYYATVTQGVSSNKRGDVDRLQNALNHQKRSGETAAHRSE